MPLWLAPLSVIVVTALALTVAESPSATPSGRRLWMASVLVFGVLAIAATVWLGRREGGEALALAGTGAAPPGSPPAPNGPPRARLPLPLKGLEGRGKQTRAGRHARS